MAKNKISKDLTPVLPLMFVKKMTRLNLKDVQSQECWVWCGPFLLSLNKQTPLLVQEHIHVMTPPKSLNCSMSGPFELSLPLQLPLVINTVIARTTVCSMMQKGSGMGLSIRPRPQRLDHPLTLGIGGIGCDPRGRCNPRGRL